MSDTNEQKTIWVSSGQLRAARVRAFIVFFALLGIGIVGFMRLYTEPQTEQRLQPSLRKVLSANEWLFHKLFSKEKLAKTFTKADAAKQPRVNGNVGMKGNLDTNSWRLRVARAPGDTLILHYTDLFTMPRTEVIFDFKCVEGWSQVTWWAGVRFSDFMHQYRLTRQTAMKYVGLVTPDGTYYVGIDMPSMLQPQTILAYEMNGFALPQNQGYPLRLIIPVKYGIKHLKRVSLIFFSDTRPADYWQEQGYDYYAGL
jgi:DMSO/TMAO reductase YedYZ molybdopterin-dependent catalytic subunit